MKIKRKIVKNGASLGIIIPPDFLKYLELAHNDIIIMEDYDGKKGKFLAIYKEEEK